MVDLSQGLEKVAKRDPVSWKPKGPREVLSRAATSTRKEYEGEGLMEKLSYWLMRQAALSRFRAIQINGGHDTVSHVWLNPPKPFSAEMVGKFDIGAYTKVDEDGKDHSSIREGKTRLS